RQCRGSLGSGFRRRAWHRSLQFLQLGEKATTVLGALAPRLASLQRPPRHFPTPRSKVVATNRRDVSSVAPCPRWNPVALHVPLLYDRNSQASRQLFARRDKLRASAYEI